MSKSASREMGHIVWAQVPDSNGIVKQRPAVFITATEQIASHQPLAFVAVTSRVREPLPDDHVVLPWHPQGHVRTGLNRRCAAVCSWVFQATIEDVSHVAGVVPGRALLEFLTKIRRPEAPGVGDPADPKAS